MLCFEVWRNGEKLTTAGVSTTGVVSFILNWGGKEPNASSIAGSASGAIPGIHCVVGGVDAAPHPAGDHFVDWYETEDLKIGDDLRVRLISSDKPDPPKQSRTVPRGNPDWAKNRKDAIQRDRDVEKMRAMAVIASIKTIGTHINELHALTDRLSSESDRRKFRRHLGEVMAAINSDILMPVVHEYPELDPDK
ncbi:MAG TPA: hypothetical protein VJR71_05205 [Pseudolabrys sp.]|nr:hypothetical protein [Pseudolabrys sp.]